MNPYLVSGAKLFYRSVANMKLLRFADFHLS